MDDIRQEPLGPFGEFDDATMLDPDAEIVELAVIPSREEVIFPNMITSLFVGRERSLRAMESALESSEPLLVVAQRDPELMDVAPEGLFEVGTEMSVLRTRRMRDGTVHVDGQGQARMKVLEWLPQGEYLRARVQLISDDYEPTLADEALMRAVISLYEGIVRLSPHMGEEQFLTAANIADPGWLADFIAGTIELGLEDRQKLLETLHPITRLQRLSVMLAQEVELLQLEEKIQTRVQDEVDKSQREYLLREQLRAIQSELGEADPFTGEVAELRTKIEAAGMPPHILERAQRELTRLEAMPPSTPEVGIIRTYLDWLLDLPWAKRSDDQIDLTHAEEVLNANHHGLPKIKDRMLEHIAVHKLAKGRNVAPILCFVGPPGTGKTSLGRSIAEALGRQFVRVSLGGIHDEAEIRGHRRTYIGAMPGRILQGMRTAGTVNPVFMLDEIDKIGADFRGDPSAALLEALDPEQNNEFSDHYLDLPYDLSQVMFVATANVLWTIPPALLDRMEIIEFSGYIEEEKLAIAQQFLIPRQLERHGLEPGSLSFSEQALKTIIREYTNEAGVRNLERELASLCRKVARVVANGKTPPKQIMPTTVERLLGPPQYSFGLAGEQDEIGLANGVAVTEAGGDLLPIEVIVMEGRGTLTLTGQLGEVMQESAQAALSYARANAKALQIDLKEFDKTDIHVHLPEGAIPKDGPSAGITMATALISALSRRPVRRDVAMTGEITLRGRVLPIGGFKEKVLAAHRAGVRLFMAPAKNRKDLHDVPRRVQRDLEIRFVERMDEVLEAALLEREPAEPKPRTRVGRPTRRLVPTNRRPPRPRAPTPRDPRPPATP